jgi:hypothetical protein
MKKTILLIALTVASLSTFAQGVIDLSWTAGSGITVGAGSNPASQQPGWFCGSDYSLQAYMASGTGQAEGSLSAIATLRTTFLGNVTSAAGGPTSAGEGLFASAQFANTGFAVGSPDTIQIRVWYDPNHNTTYEQALAQGLNTGKSALLSITPSDPTSPAAPSLDTVGMAAFSVSGGSVIPEPSTFALAGLGAAAMLIFRRRK